jgi:hypothetical protein
MEDSSDTAAPDSHGLLDALWSFPQEDAEGSGSDLLRDTAPPSDADVSTKTLISSPTAHILGRHALQQQRQQQSYPTATNIPNPAGKNSTHVHVVSLTLCLPTEQSSAV